MVELKFRQLIEMAIGTPEPGHVNFSALHCLLYCIADKMNIMDELIDYTKCEKELGIKTKDDNQELTRSSTYVDGDTDLNATEEDLGNSNVSQFTKENETESLQEADSRDNNLDNINDQDNATIVDNAAEASARSSSATKDPNASARSTITESQNVTDLESTERENSMRESIRSSKTESTRKNQSDDLLMGISIMKDQLQLTMEQLLLLTHAMLSKKPIAEKARQLFEMAQKLRKIRKENSLIRGSNLEESNSFPSIDWQASELQLLEEISTAEILEQQASTTNAHPNSFELQGCLCYSPEKMLDELMDLKSKFCLLTNKVNELTAKILQQESQQLSTLIQKLQDQAQQLEIGMNTTRDFQYSMKISVDIHTKNIANIQKSVEELIAGKVDKVELELVLANKVNYNQLQQKVSLDQVHELQCRLDKRFCQVNKQIIQNQKAFDLKIENIHETLGFAAIEGILTNFKQQIETKIKTLQELLQKYMDATNDECAAAGARTKVLQDLACLSCDTNCVMRSIEKSKVAKLPSAHASSNPLSPLITYELGSIRKSGIMGYHRKDDFPHAPHAWMQQQQQKSTDLALKEILPRQAAGSHTTSTARERYDKVIMSGK